MDPKALLKIRWRAMGKKELATHLRLILVAERKAISGAFPRHLRPRLRWRRIAVAQRLVCIGGEVSPKVFTQPHARIWSGTEGRVANVPSKYSWLGVFALVPLDNKVG